MIKRLFLKTFRLLYGIDKKLTTQPMLRHNNYEVYQIVNIAIYGL